MRQLPPLPQPFINLDHTPGARLAWGAQMRQYALNAIAADRALNGITGEAQPAIDRESAFQAATNMVMPPMDEAARLRWWFDLGFDAAARAMQPAREWVGLTDDERNEIYRKAFKLIDSRLVGEQVEFVNSIESKLREKNAGLPAAAARPSKSDMDYWNDNRERIIDAIDRAGFRLMSNACKFWLRPTADAKAGGDEPVARCDKDGALREISDAPIAPGTLLYARPQPQAETKKTHEHPEKR